VRRLVGWLGFFLVLAGCSTRMVVVPPEEVAKLGDPQWVIKAEPRPR
jgi:hypothetical protein